MQQLPERDGAIQPGSAVPPEGIEPRSAQAAAGEAGESSGAVEAPATVGLVEKLRVLVAISDGRFDTDGVAYAPGSIRESSGLPVLLNFNPLQVPIGVAELVVEDERVYADITFRKPVNVDGLRGALGGASLSHIWRVDGRREITEYVPMTVGLCTRLNSDLRIPPIPSLEPVVLTRDDVKAAL